MPLPDCPEDIIINIMIRLAEDDYSHLGPFIRAGKASYNLSAREEVLSTCNLWSLAPTNHIYPGGRVRKIFLKCLAYENTQALYLEGLRLCTRLEELAAGIHLLDKVVLADARATLASANFSVCNADQIKASTTFQLLPKHWGINHDSTNKIKLGKVVKREISWFNPPGRDIFIRSFRYPEDDVISVPDCIAYGGGHPSYPVCEKVYCEECKLF